MSQLGIQSDIQAAEYLSDILPKYTVGPVRNDGWKPSDSRSTYRSPTVFGPPSGSRPDYFSDFRNNPASTRSFNLPNDLARSVPLMMPGPAISLSIQGDGAAGPPGPQGPQGTPGVGGGGSIALNVAELTSPPDGSYTLVYSYDVMTDLYLDGSNINFDTKTVALYAKFDGITLWLRGVDPTASENVFDDWAECS